MTTSTKTPKETEPTTHAPLIQVERRVMWRDERVKDAGGFLARRTLGWFYRRDMILYGNAFFMEYGNAVKYFHPSEVLLTT